MLFLFATPPQIVERKRFPLLEVAFEDERYHHQKPMKSAISAIAIPDPTPIGPSGIKKAVSSLPIGSTLLASDLSQIEAFYKLFRPLLLPNHEQSSCAIAPFPEMTKSAPPANSSKKAGTCKSGVSYGEQQTAKWNERFEELVHFRKHNGHCVVPMHNHPNVALSNWVKRQRNQYRLKVSGRHSTLSDERQQALDDLGFVWDAHTACWEERYDQLREFYREYGHARVPKSYKKIPALATWVKCQRRQYKLMKAKKTSCITKERIRLLKKLRFDFTPRN